MNWRGSSLLFGLGVLLFATAHHAEASELKPHTAKAFQHYVDLTETRIRSELATPGKFLYLDTWPAAEREPALARIRSCQVFVQPMVTKDEGKRIEIPDGLVHHWLAIGFIPNVKLEQVQGVAQDFRRHADYFQPDVQRSELRSREDDRFHVYLRLRRHAIVTVVYNTLWDIEFTQVDATHCYSTGRATRIAEVKDPGEKDEHELPVGNDRGFLWRLNLYTRYEEADGGVYVQIEFLGLSRSVPAIFAWLVNPYIKSIPREYLTSYIRKLSDAVHRGTEKPIGAAQPGA